MNSRWLLALALILTLVPALPRGAVAATAPEAAASRGWAGIHYVIDDDIALTMGSQVGCLVCALPGANPVDGA